MTGPHRMLAAFADSYIGLHADTGWLAAELSRRWPHAMTAQEPAPPVVLNLTVTELEPSWIELQDSIGRRECGSLEPIAFLARKWATEALVAAHPDLVWIHAAAAGWGASAILLAGPAGAGKSTLLVRLLDRGWSLIADDAVAVQPRLWSAVPLPFAPEVRTPVSASDEQARFLEQPKALAPVGRNRLAGTPATIGGVVLPEYSPSASAPVLSALTVVSAAQALAAQHVSPFRRTIADLFAFAKEVPCYRLRYHDPEAAADVLTQLTSVWRD